MEKTINRHKNIIYWQNKNNTKKKIIKNSMDLDKNNDYNNVEVPITAKYFFNE